VTDKEKLLILVCENLVDRNHIAVMVQDFMSKEGPLTEEAAQKIRKLLAN
jgi:hypothetical protein